MIVTSLTRTYVNIVFLFICLNLVGPQGGPRDVGASWVGEGGLLRSTGYVAM